MTRALLILAVAACGGATPKEPTVTREQQEARCRTTADQLVLLVGGGGATGGLPQAARLHAALLERCTVDRWSFEAQDCFGDLRSIDGSDHCATLLTVPQRDGFQQAIETSLR